MPRLSSRKRVRKSASRGKRNTRRVHRNKTHRRKGLRSYGGTLSPIAIGSSYGGTLSPIGSSYGGTLSPIGSSYGGTLSPAVL
jgi:hypothetical protein